MTILDTIIADKRIEVAARIKAHSYSDLEKLEHFGLERISLAKKFAQTKEPGIIAEFKHKSPSKPQINLTADPVEVAAGYEEAGAFAMSILTDVKYFGGSDKDLLAARGSSKLPLLRKDFVIDEYQIYEARAFGADIILLIASVLDKKETYSLARKAKELGLEVLLELREPIELGHINQFCDFVGVNNRNLKDFSVNISQSLDLADEIPSEFIKVSESGISDVAKIHELSAAGYRGFLIGETFMRSENPGIAAQNFIKSL